MKKDCFHKKGQAALEFLTTYGWAILVVMVMIGALAYFGVMNPQNLVPEKCVFSSGIGCRDYAGLDTGDQIRAKLMNGFGYTIVIESVAIESSGTSGTAVDCVPGVGPAPGDNYCNLAVDTVDWRSGVEKELIVDYSALTSADRPQVLVTILYHKAGSTYTKEITGQVFVKPG